MVRELARLGADLEARNDAGQTPAQLTRDRLVSERPVVAHRADAIRFDLFACTILFFFVCFPVLYKPCTEKRVTGTDRCEQR